MKKNKNKRKLVYGYSIMYKKLSMWWVIDKKNTSIGRQNSWNRYSIQLFREGKKKCEWCEWRALLFHTNWMLLLLCMDYIPQLVRTVLNIFHLSMFQYQFISVLENDTWSQYAIKLCNVCVCLWCCSWILLNFPFAVEERVVHRIVSSKKICVL